MNNPLIAGDLKSRDYSDYIKSIEKQCSSLNRKHYFKYPLAVDHAFIWTNRNERRSRLQISFLDNEGNKRSIPFIDADDYLIESYVGKLPDFVEAYIDYCLWECPTVWS